MQDFALDGMKFNSKFLGKVKVTLNVFFFVENQFTFWRFQDVCSLMLGDFITFIK